MAVDEGILPGFRRPPVGDQGPHCRPLDPASLSLLPGRQAAASEMRKNSVDKQQCVIEAAGAACKNFTPRETGMAAPVSFIRWFCGAAHIR